MHLAVSTAIFTTPSSLCHNPGHHRLSDGVNGIILVIVRYDGKEWCPWGSQLGGRPKDDVRPSVQQFDDVQRLRVVQEPLPDRSYVFGPELLGCMSVMPFDQSH